MKALGILILTAAPLAMLTVWGMTDLSSSAGESPPIADAIDARPAAAIAEKIGPLVKSHEGTAAALLGADFPPVNLVGLDAIQPDGPLGPLRRTWPAWATARAAVDEFLSLAGAEAVEGLERLRAAKGRWETLRQKLQEAKLPASAALASLVEERVGGLQQQIARLEAQAAAAAAAETIRKAFAAGDFDECVARSREWLAGHSRSATSLADEIKALGFRAEFHLQRTRSQSRLKSASPAEQEALIAAFLARFPDSGPLAAPEQAVVERCRKYLEALRAEARQREMLRAAGEAIQAAVTDLPSGFDQRLARLAQVIEKHPVDVVKVAAQSRVAAWLEESLPEKRVEEHPELREAETKDGRIVRGFFREIADPGGTRGYKCYETPEQRQNPTVDVGTWRSEDLASAPAMPLARRLVERYQNARSKLLQQPDRRDVWEAFAAYCDRLQEQCDAYRAKPGAARELPDFRREAEFTRKLLSGSGMRDLQTVCGDG